MAASWQAPCAHADVLCLLPQRHLSASHNTLQQALQLYARAATSHMGEGVALALAEAAPLLASADAMRALHFLLSTGFLAADDAVRGLMLEAGKRSCALILCWCVLG